MNSAINLNRPANKTDFLANAAKAWGDALPDWVETLAKEAMRPGSSGASVAAKLGYTGAVVSDVINGKYRGALGLVEQKVRGAFMGATVVCPVMGETGRNTCLDEQKKTFKGTSSMRTQLFHACRRGCEHSRLASTMEESADA